MNETSTKKLSLAVLISGSGSNLQAIIDAIADHKLNATIAVVISNQSDAYGLERARKADIPTQCLEATGFSDRESYDGALQQIIDSYQPDLIVLAGFMRILSAKLVRHYRGKMINIHPSLLPKYPGLHTHAKVLQAGDKQHGSTIHFVTEDLDSGPIIAQTRLDILPHNTVDSLTERVKKLEHQLYPLVIQWFCDKRITLSNNGILFDDKYLPIYGKQVTFTD